MCVAVICVWYTKTGIAKLLVSPKRDAWSLKWIRTNATHWLNENVFVCFHFAEVTFPFSFCWWNLSVGCLITVKDGQWFVSENLKQFPTKQNWKQMSRTASGRWGKHRQMFWFFQAAKSRICFGKVQILKKLFWQHQAKCCLVNFLKSTFENSVCSNDSSTNIVTSLAGALELCHSSN